MSTRHRVLIIDDEEAIGRVLHAALLARGFDPQVAGSAAEGLEAASALEPDVIIVDLGLPDRDGVDVCRHLRRWTANPIIVLTVDDGENRKVEALDAGADDYVTKPFSVPELLARVRVAIRHREALALSVDPAVVQVGDLSIDTATHEATLGARAMQLTPKEFALLALMARNAGKVLPHQTLLTTVWGTDGGERVGQLRTHITQLRAKLGPGAGFVRIVTEPGVGYRLVATQTDVDEL
jgi:two-component system KDP operon response regulator KdpE